MQSEIDIIKLIKERANQKFAKFGVVFFQFAGAHTHTHMPDTCGQTRTHARTRKEKITRQFLSVNQEPSILEHKSNTTKNVSTITVWVTYNR